MNPGHDVLVNSDALQSNRLESMLGFEACTGLEELYLSHNGIWRIEVGRAVLGSNAMLPVLAEATSSALARACLVAVCSRAVVALQARTCFPRFAAGHQEVCMLSMNVAKHSSAGQGRFQEAALLCEERSCSW
eukprot:1157361-Pelagomonas_calceolata.AAC.3